VAGGLLENKLRQVMDSTLQELQFTAKIRFENKQYLLTITTAASFTDVCTRLTFVKNVFHCFLKRKLVQFKCFASISDSYLNAMQRRVYPKNGMIRAIVIS
jgi:hypothetical protein